MFAALPQWLITLYNSLVVFLDSSGIQNPTEIALIIIIPIALSIGYRRNF